MQSTDDGASEVELPTKRGLTTTQRLDLSLRPHACCSLGVLRSDSRLPPDTPSRAYNHNHNPTMQDTTQQPSTANIAVACAIVAGVTGYMIGQAKSLGLFGGSPISTPSQRKEKAAEESDESSDDDDEDDTAPADFKGNHEECKMVLVVRTDLGMTKGMLHIPRITKSTL
jgi:hypothetical protein